MKSSYRSRRLKGKGKEQQALLANTSPPPSPSVWGVQDNVGIYSSGGFDNNAAAVQLLAQPSLSHHPKKMISRSSPVSVRSASPANSALPPENRFVPQHEPRKGQSPENMIGTAALQFVPAYEESIPITPQRAPPRATSGSPNKVPKRVLKNSSSPTKRSSKAVSRDLLNHRPETSDAPDPWDAVIEADDSSLKSKSSKGSWRSRGSRSNVRSRRRDKSMDSLSSAEEKKSSPSASFRRRGRKNQARGPPKMIISDNSQKDEEASVISGATSAVTRSRGPRMARLASIFSSRAIVKSPPDEKSNKGPRSGTTRAAAKQQQQSAVVKPSPQPVPASPVRSQTSSGSSGYVGWPGLQDKRGKTVAMESSYDDSSVGAAAFHKKQYQDELEDASRIREKRTENLPDDEDELEDDDSFDDTKSAADFHLAAVLATAVTTPPKKKTLSPQQQQQKQHFALRNEDKFKQRDSNNFGSSSSSAGLNRYGGVQLKPVSRRSPPTHGDAASSIAATSASGALSIHNLFSNDPPAVTGRSLATQLSYKGDPWDVDSSSQPPSSPGTSVSKDSSAFFHTTGVSSEFPNLDPNYGVRTNVIGAASIIRRKKQREEQQQQKIQPQPPTEKALQVQNHLTPPPRNFNSVAVRGYRGYLDKRNDVPNLMDDDIDSDSLASSRAATSIVSEQPKRNTSRSRLQAHVAKTRPLLKSTEIDEESDVFDGLSTYGNSTKALATAARVGGKVSPSATRQTMMNGFQEHRTPQASPNTTVDDENSFNVVTLAGGLTMIQTTQEGFEKRTKPSDFDDNLSSSEVDQYGFAKTPGFNEMMNAGRSPMDSAKYVAPQQQMTKDIDEQSEGPPIRQIIPNNINKRRPVPARRSPEAETSTNFLPPREVTTSEEDSVPGEPHAIRQVIRTPNKPRNGVFDVPTSLSDSMSGDGVSEIYDGQSVAMFAYHRGGNLSKYRLHPDLSKKIVRAYRNQSRLVSTDFSVDEFLNHEDSKKAFALSEMRSRVMEKDLERGLERQGGSVAVDDIILTSYYQAAYRVRDAVIVSKAWRDGASPSDVVTASRMTRRGATQHSVKRPVRTRGSPNKSYMNDSMSVASEYSYVGAGRAYTYEAVTWLDDTDFMQMRCPSLGPRFMRGFEMFTIGDCQSILLKLTNERCIQLRAELNHATARQIDAEDMMREEGDAGDGMMTESEMIYLTTMEDVKVISKQLVVAEKSFNLVRDRIEKLVARYEAMLIKIENESIATASVITYDESSYYSDEYDSEYSSDEDDEEEEEREHEMFQRRAQRAELRAELAAREAIMAKQEAKKIRTDKQQEIDALQHRLAELQSESSFAITEREQSIVLAKAIAQKHGVVTRGSQQGSPPAMQDERINGVKAKFRERMAERMAERMKARGGTYPGNFPAVVPTPSESGSSIQPYRGNRFNSNRPSPAAVTPRPQHRPVVSARSQRRQLVGEEMYQHLDFYERSLKAVDTSTAI